MSNSPNEAVFAVLAELEAHAKKKGKKSIVKGVLRRSSDGGASEQLLGEITALRAKKKRSAGAVAETKVASKAKRGSRVNGPSKTQPDTVTLNT
jgi:hypothetical protein